MAKTIIKEAGIVILLLLAIALILGIVFYDYIPTNKTVPVKIQSYTIPDDIKEELSETFEEGQNIVRTYYIDSTDLSAYESSNDYDKGKANPFADYSVSSTAGNTASGNTNSNSNNKFNNTVANNNNTDNTNNSEVYFNKPVK